MPRALYAYADVAFEDEPLAARAVYSFPTIAFEEPGLQARAVYGFPTVAFEEPGLQARGLYGYCRVTYLVSPNTPPEWTLLSGWDVVGYIRDVED